MHRGFCTLVLFILTVISCTTYTDRKRRIIAAYYGKYTRIICGFPRTRMRQKWFPGRRCSYGLGTRLKHWIYLVADLTPPELAVYTFPPVATITLNKQVGSVVIQLFEPNNLSIIIATLFAAVTLQKADIPQI